MRRLKTIAMSVKSERRKLATQTGVNRLAHFHYVEGAILFFLMSIFTAMSELVSGQAVKPRWRQVVAASMHMFTTHSSSRGGSRSLDSVVLTNLFAFGRFDSVFVLRYESM